MAHGIAAFQQELFTKKSDGFVAHVCSKCHLLAEPYRKRNVFYCRYCDDYDSVVEVYIPYCAKLLVQECMAMNVVPYLIVEEDPKLDDDVPPISDGNSE